MKLSRASAFEIRLVIFLCVSKGVVTKVHTRTTLRCLKNTTPSWDLEVKISQWDLTRN